MGSSDGDKSAKDLAASKTGSAVNEVTNRSDYKLLPQYDPDVTPIQYRQWDGSLSNEAHDKEYMEMTLKNGKHSELVQRLLRQRIEQRAKEFPRWPANYNDGVRTVWIESRFWYDRERLLPDFDDDWRKYRAKYLHSLNLHPNEPVHVPQWELHMINPIRRFYMKPGDLIEKHIIKRFITTDAPRAEKYRSNVRNLFVAYVVASLAYYYVRFNYKRWETDTGVLARTSAPKIHYGHPQFPAKEWHQEPADYCDMGFTKRTIYKDLRDFEDTPVL